MPLPKAVMLLGVSLSNFVGTYEEAAQLLLSL